MITISSNTAEAALRCLLGYIGEDMERPGLRETPVRFVRALDEWFAGYRQNPTAVLKSFEDGGENYDGILFQGNIPVYSHCEHHFCPMHGIAHFAYIPDGRIVGLSKISRLIDVFARRLQVQERLTRQVVDAFVEHVRPRGCGLVLELRHMCMESRGVRLHHTPTTTSHVSGYFLERPHVKDEFMQLVRQAQVR